MNDVYVCIISQRNCLKVPTMLSLTRAIAAFARVASHQLVASFVDSVLSRIEAGLLLYFAFLILNTN